MSVIMHGRLLVIVAVSIVAKTTLLSSKCGEGRLDAELIQSA